MPASLITSASSRFPLKSLLCFLIISFAKLNKIFQLEDENHKVKSNINDEERMNLYKNNYYKLNIL